MYKLLVFTDLDGTLLDHETYDFRPALPALQALKDNAIPVILASSKTGAEIAQIRSTLQLQEWPAIVENGAGELPPGKPSTIEHSEYHKLRLVLEQLPPALRQSYRGFGDMSVTELVSITGLSIESAKLAQQRAFTEPGLFNGSPADYEKFVSELSSRGVSIKEGGRFKTLSFGKGVNIQQA